MQEPQTLDQIVGANLRRLRDRDGITQDQVARLLRHKGMPWTQPVVAALEAGTKTLDVMELYALTLVAPLEELLAGSRSVRFGTTEVPLDVVRATFIKRSHGERTARPGALSPKNAAELPTFFDAVWAGNDAERKAARRLGVDPVEVVNAAYELWGQSLTEKRDAVVEATAPPDISPRTRQAFRGRVTRTLLNDIRQALHGVPRKPRSKRTT